MIKSREDAVAWKEKYALFSPETGEKAPDFTLLDVQGQAPMTLSQFGGKRPVALVFGSFT